MTPHNTSKSGIHSIWSFFQKKETLHGSLYVLFFCFTLAPFLASVSLALFCAISLLHFNKNTYNKENIIAGLLFSIPVFIYIIGYFFSPNKAKALTLVLRVFPMLAVPFLMIGSNVIQGLNMKTLKKVFVYGLVLSISLSLLSACYNYYLTRLPESFLYYELGAFLHIHPTYYSLFILTGIFFLSQKGFEYSIKKRFILILGLTLFVLLLQSKAAIIILLGYYILLFFLKRINALGNWILILVFVMSMSMFVGYQIGASRLVEVKTEINSDNIGSLQENGISQRMWLWDNAVYLSKKKLAFGHGLGSQRNLFAWQVEKRLLENNASRAYQKAAKKIARLNLHNQYFQMLYELGLFGLILFLLSKSVLIYKATSKKQKSLFISVMLSYLLFLFTENLIDRQLGVYFYSVIIPLFYLAMEDRSAA